jgi:hypothetical protein
MEIRFTCDCCWNASVVFQEVFNSYRHYWWVWGIGIVSFNYDVLFFGEHLENKGFANLKCAKPSSLLIVD